MLAERKNFVRPPINNLIDKSVQASYFAEIFGWILTWADLGLLGI
jgi:hypothetical protein